jgi:pimeloyl-ACP methyl ester carboxylesterase
VPKLTARADKDEFDDPEFTFANDASYFIDSGLIPDTFAISTDDNIRLSGLFFKPDTNLFDTVLGTVILLHGGDTDRTALIPYINPLLDSGLAIVIYDQRACGFSGGKYYASGDYEADDLVQIIIDLNFRQLLFPPLITVGFDLGADAVINASQKEKRINGVIAIEPYFTSSRWISMLTRQKEALAIPLYKMVYFWWYQKLTGFPFDRTGVDDIQPVETNTVLIMSEENLDSEEAVRLQELSVDIIKTVKQPDKDKLTHVVLEYIFSLIKTTKI